MAKLAVITDPTLAPGFRLAGVEVHVTSTVEEAKQRIFALMREGEMGIIAINASYLSAFDEPTRRRMEESSGPVVVALPAGMAVAAEERRSRLIAELVRRAIGFRITFRGEE
jgi:vacuolar-type H+-ATPase subunit F/Vma7